MKHLMENWKKYQESIEEIEEIQKEHLIKEDQLRERIRNDLSQTMSSEDINEIAEFLLSEVVTEDEDGWQKGEGNPFTKKAWTGPGQMASDMKMEDNKTASGRLENLGELVLWLVDWIPNAVQLLEKADIEVSPGLIKGLRIMSRFVMGPFVVLGKTLKKTADLIRKSPPAVQAALKPVLGGDVGSKDVKQLATAAAGAAADKLPQAAE